MTSAERTPRIGVIGGVNMDIHLFDVQSQDSGADFFADRYLVEPGGKGTNQARASATLGAEVTLVGRVGDDEFGRLCVASAQQHGVDTQWVRVDVEERTGFVVIRLIEGQHRSLVFVPGANRNLSWDDVLPALEDLRTCDAVITQTEIPMPVLSELCDWAIETGISLFLDPASPRDVTLSALRTAEVLTPDMVDAAELVGRRLDTMPARVLAVEELLDLGVRRVILKLGQGGSLLGDADGIRPIETLHIEAVDETGAGDVFVAALALRRAEGSGWDEATRFANAAAALSVSRSGFAIPAVREVMEAAPAAEAASAL
jgi:ribokinase